MARPKYPQVQNARQLKCLIEDLGFLPFVRNDIEGFSLEECTPQGMWFVKGVEGPWEWREEIAESGEIAYGKLFRRKAGFIAPAWYRVFAGWRRGPLDFDARYQRGEIPHTEKRLYDLLRNNGPMRSRDLRGQIGKGYETAITSLQMRTDVLVQRFEYSRNAMGLPYGMGVTRFALSDQLFDASPDPGISADDQLSIAVAHIQSMFPQAGEKSILRLLR